MKQTYTSFYKGITHAVIGDWSDSSCLVECIHHHDGRRAEVFYPFTVGGIKHSPWRALEQVLLFYWFEELSEPEGEFTVLRIAKEMAAIQDAVWSARNPPK